MSAIANQIPWDQIKEGQYPPKIDIQTKNWLLVMCTSAFVYVYVYVLYNSVLFYFVLNKSYFLYKL